MALVLITGSAGGLGRLAAESVLDGGHDVIVHARNDDRLDTMRDLVARGAATVVGDLADLEQTRDVAEQVTQLGPVDAVIHNAGVLSGPSVLPVNVVAPYLLTALIRRPKRLVYLSSSMHRGGQARLTGMDWTGHETGSYSDSKLFVTALAFAVARRWPDVLSNAVHPGWVPTRMGGPGASDNLTLGHRTQEWLAVSDDPDARTTGGYWHHQTRLEPHPACRDTRFQDELMRAICTRAASIFSNRPIRCSSANVRPNSDALLPISRLAHRSPELHLLFEPPQRFNFLCSRVRTARHADRPACGVMSAWC